jgi:hypothetical protein
MTYVIAEPCIATKDNSCVEDQLPEEWRHFTAIKAEYYARTT